MKKKVVNINSKRQPILETDEEQKIIKITIQYNGNIYIGNYFGEIHYQFYAANIRDFLLEGGEVKDVLKDFVIDNNAEIEVPYSYRIEGVRVYEYIHDLNIQYWDCINDYDYI
jgi:hypothetical protein